MAYSLPLGSLASESVRRGPVQAHTTFHRMPATTRDPVRHQTLRHVLRPWKSSGIVTKRRERVNASSQKIFDEQRASPLRTEARAYPERFLVV
jgi:hypothetical protein